MAIYEHLPTFALDTDERFLFTTSRVNSIFVINDGNVTANIKIYGGPFNLVSGDKNNTFTEYSESEIDKHWEYLGTLNQVTAQTGKSIDVSDQTYPYLKVTGYASSGSINIRAAAMHTDDVITAIGNTGSLAVNGTIELTGDWDIGDGRKISADEISARDGDGLKLYDDGGNGIFVEDGGQVGIGTESPSEKLEVDGNIKSTGDIDADSYLVNGLPIGISDINNLQSTLDGYLTLDQTTQQTIINDVPLLESTRTIDELHNLVDKKYVDNAVTALGARYYMTDTASGVGTYYLTANEDPAVGFDVSFASLTDDQLITGWISPAGVEFDKMIAGVYNWNIFAEKTSGTRDLRVYWTLTERKVDNSETVIATSSTSDLITSKRRLRVPLTLSNDYTISTGSRIVGKIYAVVGSSGSAPTIKIYGGGVDDSHWEIPTNIEILENNFILLDGSNANTNIDIGTYDFTTSGDITGGKILTDEINAIDAAGLKLYDDDNNGIFVEDGGRVGIGTESPSSKLTVVGDIHQFSNTPTFLLYNADTAQYSSAVIQMKNEETADDPTFSVILQKESAGAATGISTWKFRQTNNGDFIDYLDIGETSNDIVFNSFKTAGLSYGSFIVNNGSVIFNNSGGNNNFQVKSNNEDYMLYVDGTNDKVGIGTNSLTDILNVVGNMRLTNESESYSTSLLYHYATGASYSGFWATARSRGTEASPSAVQNADSLGGFAFQGYNGSDFISTASIQAYTIENFTGSVSGSELRFYTTPATSNSSEQLFKFYQDSSGVSWGVFNGDTASVLRFSDNNAALNKKYGNIEFNSGEFIIRLDNDDSSSKAVALTVTDAGQIIANNLVTINATNGTEGGELALNKGTSYTYASIIDNQADKLRIYGFDGSSSVTMFNGDLATGNATFEKKLGVEGQNSWDANYSLQLPNSASQKAKANSWDTYSDKVLKENIRKLDNGIDLVMKMIPRRFNYKNDKTSENIGFIAQELDDVLPEVVTGEDDGSGGMGISYAHITSVLTKAIQEQQEEIDKLKQILNCA